MTKGKGFMSPLAVGMMAGAVLGAAAFSMSSSGTRHKLENRARKTIKNISDLVD